MSSFVIDSIKMNNFRSYSSKIYTFSPNINILYGDNAVGKTSVLEAIAYLALCKSFKGSKDKDLVKRNEEYFFIKGVFCENDETKTEITASFKEKEKKIKKNNYIFQKLSDYIGYFNVVTFEPADLNLIKGSPVERRKFLDVNISQFDSKYMLSIMKYNKILKKRNDFLKSIEELSEKNVQLLEVLDEMLATEAIEVMKSREKFVFEINDHVKKMSNKISKEKEIVSVEYKCADNVENFVKNLRQKRKYDFVCKSTSVGPHRDDLNIKINGTEADLYASQGQTRTAVISIKLGLAEYLRKVNENQIVLLDDVFSELDYTRQSELLSLLNEKTQVFITTTTVSTIKEDILSKSRVIKVEKETEA